MIGQREVCRVSELSSDGPHVCDACGRHLPLFAGDDPLVAIFGYSALVCSLCLEASAEEMKRKEREADHG